MVFCGICNTSDNDGAQCNGDFFDAPIIDGMSSQPKQLGSISKGGWVGLPNDAPVTIAVAKLMHASKIDHS